VPTGMRFLQPSGVRFVILFLLLPVSWSVAAEPAQVHFNPSSRPAEQKTGLELAVTMLHSFEYLENVALFRQVTVLLPFWREALRTHVDAVSAWVRSAERDADQTLKPARAAADTHPVTAGVARLANRYCGIAGFQAQNGNHHRTGLAPAWQTSGHFP